MQNIIPLGGLPLQENFENYTFEIKDNFTQWPLN